MGGEIRKIKRMHRKRSSDDKSKVYPGWEGLEFRNPVLKESVRTRAQTGATPPNSSGNTGEKKDERSTIAHEFFYTPPRKKREQWVRDSSSDEDTPESSSDQFDSVLMKIRQWTQDRTLRRTMT
jgi:hypothetical protein